MRRKILLTLVALAFALAGYGFTVPPPLPPSLVVGSWEIDTILEVDVIYVHSEWVVDRFLRVEIVTDGIQINWIAETPPWVVSPEPNAYLPYNRDLDSYCRFIAFGESDAPQWECVSKTAWGKILYQRFDLVDGTWGRRIWPFDRMVGQ